MNSIKYITIIVLSVLFYACDSDDQEASFTPIDLYENYEGEVFQINFYTMKTGKGIAEVDAYVQEIQNIVTSQNGELLINPIQITDPLIQNSGLPSTVRSFDYDFVLLFRFSDENAYQFAVNNEKYIRIRIDFEREHTDKAVETINLLAPPPEDGTMAPPVLGTFETRPNPPSFFLLNLGTFVNTPEAQQSFQQYLEAQVPRVIQAETIFTNQFVNTMVQRGDFKPTDLISFTEWKDQAAFDHIHEDANAVEHIFPLRNNALLDLVEAKAVISK